MVVSLSSFFVFPRGVVGFPRVKQQDMSLGNEIFRNYIVCPSFYGRKCYVHIHVITFYFTECKVNETKENQFGNKLFLPSCCYIPCLHTWCIHSFWLLTPTRELSMYFLRTSVHSGLWDNFRKKIPPYKKFIGQMDFPSWSKCCVCTHGMVNSKVSKWEMALLLNKANPLLTHLLCLLTCFPS